MDRQDIAYTIGSLFAIYAVYYMVAAFNFPEYFLRNVALARRPKGRFYEERISKIWRISSNIIAFFALGYFVYRATEPLVDCIPFDWGGFDEDGKWGSSRDTIRLFLTPAGLCWLPFACEKVAKSTAKDNWDLDMGQSEW